MLPELFCRVSGQSVWQAKGRKAEIPVLKGIPHVVSWPFLCCFPLLTAAFHLLQDTLSGEAPICSCYCVSLWSFILCQCLSCLNATPNPNCTLVQFLYKLTKVDSTAISSSSLCSTVEDFLRLQLTGDIQLLCLGQDEHTELTDL